MNLRCPLCGFEYDASQCHADCPMAKSCQMARCPNCGYEVPVGSSLARLWQRLRRKGKEEDVRKGD